ncbi:hypothetical protein AMECASPLE_017144 [Ameca splendens]|uniref:Uncharacterized protein n=1 Tax=Ameca splendens TaxID=208324 RepID=A0ABV0XR83_9TELE
MGVFTLFPPCAPPGPFLSSSETQQPILGTNREEQRMERESCFYLCLFLTLLKGVILLYQFILDYVLRLM